MENLNKMQAEKQVGESSKLVDHLSALSHRWNEMQTFGAYLATLEKRNTYRYEQYCKEFDKLLSAFGATVSTEAKQMKRAKEESPLLSLFQTNNAINNARARIMNLRTYCRTFLAATKEFASEEEWAGFPDAFRASEEAIEAGGLPDHQIPEHKLEGGFAGGREVLDEVDKLQKKLQKQLQHESKSLNIIERVLRD
ncbi:hypothetical protein B0A49_05935 [Cryomyces minteri]|uniref:Uncharacterized protein n=1 Tax=Cryomyces minteri TaxID=331657 RepID=A0A4U0WCY8_9PEZI|nr:hypothetical protein B0A49_05935 [Cryomyces minteri]